MPEPEPVLEPAPTPAALPPLLGVPDGCERVVDRDGLHAYAFRVKDRTVAVAWCRAGSTRRVDLDPKGRAYDIMGNPVAGREVVLGETPVYLVGPTAEMVLAPLTR